MKRALLISGVAIVGLGLSAAAYAQAGAEPQAEDRARPPASEERDDVAPRPAGEMDDVSPPPSQEMDEPSPRSTDEREQASPPPTAEREQAAPPPTAEREQASPDGSQSEYVVKEGDTLSEIAKELTGNEGNWNEIARENGIDDPTKLKVGQRLRIPSSLTSA